MLSGVSRTFPSFDAGEARGAEPDKGWTVAWAMQMDGIVEGSRLPAPVEILFPHHQRKSGA
jgi:hypothetical protein